MEGDDEDEQRLLVGGAIYGQQGELLPPSPQRGILFSQPATKHMAILSHTTNCILNN
jgi:hypothetical protein